MKQLQELRNLIDYKKVVILLVIGLLITILEYSKVKGDSSI